MTYLHWDSARGNSGYYVHGSKLLTKRYIAAVFSMLLIIVSGPVAYKTYASVEGAAEISPYALNVKPPQGPLVASAITPEVKPDTSKDEFDTAKLNQVLQSWSQHQVGSHGVVITDEQGSILASANPDETFFTASIYKLLVAYIGYQKIDDGTYRFSDISANGWTVEKCLDEMIRSSDSPCAERIMLELGKDNIHAKLSEYGLTQTSLASFTASPSDVSIILARLESGSDLSASSKAKLKDSMLGQKYRNGLPKGFETSKTYNKVGFNDLAEYHDAGIIQLADGRSLTITVMTDGVGVVNISQLASALFEAM